jgi:hypothetical protein
MASKVQQALGRPLTDAQLAAAMRRGSVGVVRETGHTLYSAGLVKHDRPASSGLFYYALPSSKDKLELGKVLSARNKVDAALLLGVPHLRVAKEAGYRRDGWDRQGYSMGEFLEIVRKYDPRSVLDQFDRLIAQAAKGQGYDTVVLQREATGHGSLATEVVDLSHVRVNPQRRRAKNPRERSGFGESLLTEAHLKKEFSKEHHVVRRSKAGQVEIESTWPTREEADDHRWRISKTMWDDPVTGEVYLLDSRGRVMDIRSGPKGEVTKGPLVEIESVIPQRYPPGRNPKKKNPKKAKKAARRATPEWQRLINRCQKLWEHYCERPGKKRLKDVLAHLKKMKESESAKVKAERRRCLRVAKAEAKKLKVVENPRKELYIRPNQSAILAAKRGLEARKKAPKSKKGGLSAMQAAEEGVGSGVLRARDIVAGKKINAYQVKAFFDRHQQNHLNAKLKGLKPEESKAIQAWLLWGGEPLRKQVESAVRRDKAKRLKVK